MTSVISAIGEATGMKPDNKVIGMGLVDAAKGKAQAYMTAVMGATSPDLRHIFLTHLQDALTEQEHVTALAIKKGWLKPELPPSEMVKEAANEAKALLH